MTSDEKERAEYIDKKAQELLQLLKHKDDWIRFNKLYWLFVGCGGNAFKQVMNAAREMQGGKQVKIGR